MHNHDTQCDSQYNECAPLEKRDLIGNLLEIILLLSQFVVAQPV